VPGAIVIVAVRGFLRTEPLRRSVDLADHPDATTTPGLLLVRPDGPVFFATPPTPARRTPTARNDLAAPQVVVLDLRSSFRLSVPTIDQRGLALWLARIRSTATAELQASGPAHRLGPTHLHSTVEDAVQAHTNSDRQSPSQ
jgi:SulP family sulfate permease